MWTIHLLSTALFGCADIVPCVKYVCIVSTFSGIEYGSTRYGYQGQLNRKPVFALSQFAPENLASRDGFGRPVPRQPIHYSHSGNIRYHVVLTHGIPPAFRDGVHLSRQPPSGQFQVDQVTQLRAEGIYYRESFGDLFRTPD